MPEISPSIASANQLFLAEELKRLGGAYSTLHVDIEDGNFVSNISFGMKTVRKLNEVSPKPLSVHLMVTNPRDYLPELLRMNTSHLFVHVENQVYLLELINIIKASGVKAGIALNPISNLSDYQYILGDIDAVLYMTAEPDARGERFNPNVVEKILPTGEHQYEIWVDGGVKREHLPLLEAKGVDTIIMGRELFENDPAKILTEYNYR